MKNFKCLWIVACCLSLSACIPEQKKGVADAVEGSDTSSTADMVVQPPGCVEGLANARFCISGTLRDVLTGAPITGLTWSNYRLMVLNLSSLTPKATACKVDPVLGWIGTPTYFDSCPLNKSRNATYNATTGAFEIKDLPAGSPDSQLVLYLVDLTAPIADRVLVLTMQLVPGYSGKVENFANVDVWALRSADVDRIYRLEDPEQNKPVVYENWTDLNNLTAVLVKVIGDKRSGLRVVDTNTTQPVPAWPCEVTDPICDALGLGTDPSTDAGLFLVPRPENTSDQETPVFKLTGADAASYGPQTVWFRFGIIWIAPFVANP